MGVLAGRLSRAAAVAAACAALWSWAAPAAASEVRIAVGCPEVDACSDWLWARDFAQRLNEGGMPARVFANGALGRDPEVVDQLSQGLLQVGLTNFVMIRQVDQTVVGFNLPYLFADQDHMFRTIDRTDIVAGIDQRMNRQGLRIAGLIGLGGPVGIFNDKRPVASVADLRGLRLRAIDRSQLTVLENWGVNGVVVDMAEVAAGLQSGVLDGYVNPPVVALIFNHTDRLRHYTDAQVFPGFRAALMSHDWYRGLTAAQRRTVDEAAAAATAANREWTRRMEVRELEILAQRGVTVTRLSPEARAEFETLSRRAWPALLPADVIRRFEEAAAATR